MTRKMIDAETGEIIEVASYRTEAQQEAYRKKQEQRVNKSDNPFIFTEKDGVQFMELLTMNNKQLGYFLVLQTYIDYNNMLRHQGAKLPMKKVDVRKALKLSNQQSFKKLMAEFEELGLIYFKEVEMYGKTYEGIFINDKYCFKKGLQGDNRNRKTKDAVKIFVDSLQEVYSQKKVNAGDIGLIYKAIQYLHYDTNFIAENPAEMDIHAVRPLSLDDFAEAVGMSRQALHKKLIHLIYPCVVDGKELELVVFARVKARGYTFFKLNPFVAWRKAGEPPIGAYAEFILEHNMRTMEKVRGGN